MKNNLLKIICLFALCLLNLGSEAKSLINSDEAQNNYQIKTKSISQIPHEAQQIIKKIQKGDSAFDYAKDGTIFRNREKILPTKTPGYYREYTVRTPGIRSRGARRIVAGKRGEFYYTDDHYRSFVRVKL